MLRGSSAGARRSPTSSCRRVGGDLALFQRVNRRLARSEGAVDRTFVDRALRRLRRAGRAPRSARRGRRCSPPPASSAAPPSRLVDRVAAATRIIVCWAMGLTQHRQAVATIREIVNTLLLRGSIGRRGAGLCPVRGHSNVQGDRTMGIDERPSRRLPRRLAAAVRLRRRRASHGYDTVDAIAGDGGGRRRRLRRPGRQLRRRRARHRGDERGAGPLRAHGAGVDEAQPLARALRGRRR